MTTTHPRFEVPVDDTGRDLDVGTLLRQMNPATVLAVSGGRWIPYGFSSVRFPCGAGFEVLVTLEAGSSTAS